MNIWGGQIDKSVENGLPNVIYSYFPLKCKIIRYKCQIICLLFLAGRQLFMSW